MWTLYFNFYQKKFKKSGKNRNRSLMLENILQNFLNLTPVLLINRIVRTFDTSHFTNQNPFWKTMDEMPSNNRADTNISPNIGRQQKKMSKK